LLTAASDAVDGSSTGTRVPWMWGLLELLLRRNMGLLGSVATVAPKWYQPPPRGPGTPHNAGRFLLREESKLMSGVL
jgi:hypothetical protein